MPWSREPDRRRGQPPAQKHRIMTAHNGLCHVCRHPGADEIDHIINVARWLREHRDGSPHRDSNLAPIHQRPCPTCGHECHKTKTAGEAQAGRATRRRPPEPHPGRIHPG